MKSKYRLFLEAAEIVASRHADHIRVHRHYSGRGMFGRHCLGITIDREVSEVYLGAQLFSEFLVLEGETIPDQSLITELEVLGILANARTDSMGTGTIIYFPEIDDEPNQGSEVSE